MFFDLIILTLGVLFLLFFTVGIATFMTVAAVRDLVKAIHKQVSKDLSYLRALKEYEGSEPI